MGQRQHFLTSNQVHVDEVWFDVSRLLWLVSQALQGETDRRRVKEETLQHNDIHAHSFV